MFPSGDHTGHASASESLVNCRSPDPSTCWTHTSALPVVLDTNATRDPSGESDECITASPGIEVIRRGAPAPRSSGMVQTFRLPIIALVLHKERPSVASNEGPHRIHRKVDHAFCTQPIRDGVRSVCLLPDLAFYAAGRDDQATNRETLGAAKIVPDTGGETDDDSGLYVEHAEIVFELCSGRRPA